jgi:hypothetical protein
MVPPRRRAVKGRSDPAPHRPARPFGYSPAEPSTAKREDVVATPPLVLIAILPERPGVGATATTFVADGGR